VCAAILRDDHQQFNHDTIMMATLRKLGMFQLLSIQLQLLTVLALLTAHGSALSINKLTTAAATTNNNSRRLFLLSSITSAATAAVTFPSSASAVISSKYCASGVGDGCDELNQGNEYIKSLQETSAAHKDRYAREARDAYYMKNYPDYFAAVGMELVRKSDGSYASLDLAQVEQLKRENRLTLEVPKAMGGRITDLTQKPVWIMKE
jgi:hypothetical protein